MRTTSNLFIAALLILGLASCQKKELENTNIPSAPVSFVLDVSLSGVDNALRYENVGSSKVYDTRHPATMSSGHGMYGFSGVVVTRAMDNKLYAFDVCCPYEVQKDNALVLDGFFVKCNKCGSSFEIGNGSGRVNKGPAEQPLKRYNVYEAPSGLCTVTY